MELPLLLRRNHRIAIAAGIKIFFVSGAIFLAGCSSVPSAYNPIDWTQSSVDEVSSWFAGKPAPEGVNVEPPAAEGRSYPNLASVPKPPPRVTPEIRAQRQREIADLVASRQSALTADAALRTTDAVPSATPAAVTPPAPVVLSPIPTPTVTGQGGNLPASTVTLAAVAPAATAQRIGSVAFARNGTTPSAASQGVLQAAVRTAAGTAGQSGVCASTVSSDGRYIETGRHVR
jgi:hypothetical protein